MPIKFRCEYCRQLLGIAESKAASLVDCPTCGRTLRVPNRDGTIERPPKPAVNLADDGLRRALDELAQIGRPDEDDLPLASRPTPPRPGAIEKPVEVKAPVPKLAAVPVTPNPIVNAIALEPLPPMKVVDAATPDGALAAVTIAEVSPEEVLAGLAAQAAPSRPPPTSPPERVATRGIPLWVVAVTSGLSLLVGVAGGIGVAGYLATPTIPPAPPGNSEPARPADDARPQVKGRLTFRNAQKQLQPDSGACVLILPAKREGEKLATAGFRPNDEGESRQAAAKQLAGQGGRLTRAEEDGSFQVELPEGEDYTLIALSHFQGVSGDDEGSQDSLQKLAEYFERPEQLVGKLAFHVASIKRSESGTVIWDHTFGE